MRARPRPIRPGIAVHRPTVLGRLRVDRDLLTLTALVVALASALLASIWPLTVRTADDAVREQVREAGSGAAVVATLPRGTQRGMRQRDPGAVDRFELDVEFTGNELPERWRSTLRPRLAAQVSESLQVVAPGQRREMRLVYVGTPIEPPSVTWLSGAAPGSTAEPGQEGVLLAGDDPPWPVEVGLSRRVARELGVRPGDALALEDQYGYDVDVRVSGIYVADEPEDEAWTVSRELLSPTTVGTEGNERTYTAALASSASLPDLQIAVPADQLTQRITFLPEPSRVRWEQAPDLREAVVELKARPGIDSGQTGWDSVLDRVLDDAEAQIDSARGRAQLLLVGLVVSTALTLLLAALLLVRRRAGPLALARERGATLLGLAGELVVESAPVTAVGAGAGVAVAAVLAGAGGAAAAVPVVAVGVLAAPVLGALEVARVTGVRRTPANRAARRVAERRRKVRRLVLELGVVVLAVLAYLALRQRGPAPGDLTPAGAPALWAVVGALLVVRVLPVLVRRAQRRAQRSAGGTALFVTARVASSGTRALPLAVVAVAVAQLAFGSALAATQLRGQESGALLAVGGDARLATVPAREVLDRAATARAAPGVDLAVAGRVADQTLVSARSTGAAVRLLVVDAGDYERLLADSDLPDAPQLSRLTEGSGAGEPVPALLLGGPEGLDVGTSVRWGSDQSVPLRVVGEAPRVDASTDPVVVVDAAAFAAAGAVADPDTIWAVGPGAADALRQVAAADLADSVTTYDERISRLRDEPLPAALADLALAASFLLALLAALGVVLGAAVDAPARAVSLGRLRSLGLPDRDVRRVLAGELLVPVLAGVLVGLGVGVLTAWATIGPLDLAALTDQDETPRLAVPPWTWLAAAALLVVPVIVALRQHRRLRRRQLASLLRAGDAHQL